MSENNVDPPLYIRRRGKIQGPFDGVTIREMVDSNRLFRSDEVSFDLTQWTPAARTEWFKDRSVGRKSDRLAPQSGQAIEANSLELLFPDGSVTESGVQNVSPIESAQPQVPPNLASRRWYYAIGDQQHGPIAEAEILPLIRSGAITPSTLVWCEGMSEWFSAASAPGFASYFTDGTSTGSSRRLANDFTQGRTTLAYAGFRKRFYASILDGFFTMIGSVVAGFVLGIVMVLVGVRDPELLGGLGYVFGIILGWIYNAGLESSAYQATLGKMALGIKVTDMKGDRIGFGKATGRYFGKIVSGLIFMIGFLMVAFTEKKQGLHDMMAGCLVVND